MGYNILLKRSQDLRELINPISFDANLKFSFRAKKESFQNAEKNRSHG